MKTKVLLLFIFMMGFKVNIHAQFSLDAETGLVFTGYNNVRFPGNGGTLFSLKTDIPAKTKVFYRLRASCVINERHYISALFAPLTVSASGSVNKPIIFRDLNISANTPINASYTFNSYRLTYRYDFISNDKLKLGAGFSAKIRYAGISIFTPTALNDNKNIGFVPLINLNFAYQFTQKIGMVFNADAFAAPQGRAEDVLLAVNYKINKNSKLRLGYRLLEGGSDGASAYNFVLLLFLTAGITYQF